VTHLIRTDYLVNSAVRHPGCLSYEAFEKKHLSIGWLIRTNTPLDIGLDDKIVVMRLVGHTSNSGRRKFTVIEPEVLRHKRLPNRGSLFFFDGDYIACINEQDKPDRAVVRDVEVGQGDLYDALISSFQNEVVV